MLSDSGKVVICDFEDCVKSLSVKKGEIGHQIDHPERVLLAKAERRGWVSGEYGEKFYCPDHTIAGIKIGNKFT